jgi:hypothetical protein
MTVVQKSAFYEKGHAMLGWIDQQVEDARKAASEDLQRNPAPWIPIEDNLLEGVAKKTKMSVSRVKNLLEEGKAPLKPQKPPKPSQHPKPSQPIKTPKPHKPKGD